MNLHVRRNHLDGNLIDARPIDRFGPYGEVILDEVIVESVHPSGHGLVHLTPDQAVALLSRLTQLDAAFLHGTPRTELILQETRSASDEGVAWPVVRTNGGGFELDEVVVAGGDRRETVHLSPEQVRDLERRLVSLALVYLHENCWGGEDARAQ